MEELEWEILEHEHRQNEEGWFWALGIIALSVSVASAIYGNYLFSVLIVIAGFTVGIYATKAPGMLSVRLTDKDISVNERILPYTEITSFSIDRDKLIFEERVWWRPLFIIPMHHGDIEIIANSLREILPEKQHKEPIAHQIMEHLGV
ncbi:MAG: hypothetical protein AAB507_01675 [Patescibacteria group bacterium]